MQNVVLVRRWANSRAIVIPRHIQKELNWRVGDVLMITQDGQRLTFQRAVISPLQTNNPSTIAEQPAPDASTRKRGTNGDR